MRLVGTDDPRDAVGASVRVQPTGQPQSLQTQWAVAGGGYLASNDPRLHFVWPTVIESFEIEITWPSGQKQSLLAVRPDQCLVIVQR